MTFDWEDPLHLTQQLTEEEQLVHATARSYAREQLMPRVLEASRHEHFDA
ncbi:MAG: acyl-CoA dehydrogenase, partial [Proteobacteria bacterium]|nr:acyl-CoA dehydrogenase [Pseudomonadota bacterium]